MKKLKILALVIWIPISLAIFILSCFLTMKDPAIDFKEFHITILGFIITYLNIILIENIFEGGKS